MFKGFAERHGFKKLKIDIQSESMDGTLKTRLWNFLLPCWKAFGDELNLISYEKKITMDWPYFTLFQKIWDEFFKEPIDTMPSHFENLYQEIRRRFFEFEWYDVYGFLEFLFNNFPYQYLDGEKIIQDCNRILEEERSAYRYIHNVFTKIIGKEEISEIEEALSKTEPLKPVKIHLNSALKKLSDRKNPDYRNSINMSSLKRLSLYPIRGDLSLFGSFNAHVY